MAYIAMVDLEYTIENKVNGKFSNFKGTELFLLDANLNVVYPAIYKKK